MQLMLRACETKSGINIRFENFATRLKNTDEKTNNAN